MCYVIETFGLALYLCYSIVMCNAVQKKKIKKIQTMHNQTVQIIYKKILLWNTL